MKHLQYVISILSFPFILIELGLLLTLTPPFLHMFVVLLEQVFLAKAWKYAKKKYQSNRNGARHTNECVFLMIFKLHMLSQWKTSSRKKHI